MKVQILRAGAAPELDAARECALLRAIRVSEAVSEADVVNPTIYPNANINELTLQPNTIYRAFTGLAFPGLALREIQVTASSKFFLSHGLRIERVEVDASSELRVYFSLLRPLKFVRDAQMFEFRTLAIGAAAPLVTTTADAMLPDAPGIPQVAGESRTIRTVDAPKPAPAARPTTSAEAWLSSPDRTPGRVVDEASIPSAAAQPTTSIELKL